MIHLLAAWLCLVPAPLEASSWDSGLRLMNEKRYVEAVPFLERAAREDPGSPEVLLNLGWAYWHIKRLPDAARVGSTLLKLDSENPKFLIFMANTHIELKQYRQAARLIKRALTSYPESKDAAVLLARAQFGMGRQNEALALLDDLIKRLGDSPDLMFRRAAFLTEMGRSQEAVRELDRLIAGDPGNPAYRKYRARALYELGRSKEAISEWQAVVRRRRDTAALLNLGWAQWHEGRLDEAWKTGNALLQIDANNPAALRFVANLHMVKTDFTAALALVRKILRLAPADRDASLLLIKALCALHRPKEASEVLARLLREYPDVAAVQYTAADFAMRTGRPDEATQRFDRLLKIYPNNDVYRLGRAQLLYDLGRFDDALADWKILTQREPPSLPALRRMRDDAVNRLAWREAISWQERLLQVKAPESEDWFKLAELYLATNSYSGTLRSAEMAISADPMNISGYYMKASALELMDDWPAVREVYADIVRQNPNSQRAVSGLSYAMEARRDYRGALRELHKLQEMILPSVSDHSRIREAVFLAESGDAKEAQRLLKEYSRQRRLTIPVILYHGLSPLRRSDALWVENFRKHMSALRAHGYNPVTVTELDQFFQGQRSLPSKPIAITFDDGRVDSFVNADPILKEMGFKATMFVQVSPRRKWHFHANSEDLTEWRATGRWDLQAHGYLAHDLIQIDGNGRKGRFFANRMWLASENRLETLKEFRSRLESEYAQAREKVAELTPGNEIVAFAYPFGDYGQADFTNTPEAAAFNRELVRKNFHMAFVQEQFGFNSSHANLFDLKRFEVTKNMTAEQLIEHLTVYEPWVQAKLTEADLAIRTEQVGRAQDIYAQLTSAGIDQPPVWAGRGNALRVKGDAFTARRMLAQADSVQMTRKSAFERQTYGKALNAASDAASPTFGSDGRAFSDSESNTNTFLAVRASGWARSARIQGWVGEGRYEGRGHIGDSITSLRSREGGLGARIYAGERLEVNGSYGRRYILGENRKAFDLYAAEAAFQLHPRLRVALRDGMGNVETTAAILHDRRFHNDGAGLSWDPVMNWKASADFDVDRYNDSNRDSLLRLRLQRRFFEAFTVGAAYLHGDSRWRDPDYYTPRGLNQYTGLAGIGHSFGPRSYRTAAQRGYGTVQYEGGYGFQHGESRVVHSVRAKLDYVLLDPLAVSLEGQYSISPSYISRQAAAGVTLRY
jgi:tetratricopeptide (TPR) repeat protein